MLTIFQQTIHNHMGQILKEKYSKNAKAIERIASVLLTKGDAEEFVSLANDLYKTGFERAAESYKEQLVKLGYQIRVNHPNDGV